jgi:hypothetical protein
MPVVNQYNLFLSSANRTSGTSSDYHIVLRKPLSLQSPNNWFTVRVGSCEIPYIFKLIDSTNNVIQYSITRSSVTTNGTFTIEAGNYNILNLLTEVTTKLQASILSLIGYTAPLNLTYDRNAGHCTFSIVGIDATATSILIKNNSPVFLKCVGFSNQFTFSYTNSTTRTDIDSTQNVNVYQNPAIYVRSETLIQSQNVESLITAQSEPSDILAKIQVNVQPQTMIQWTNPTDLVLEINNKIIDDISLYLGSSTSYSLDLGGLDWTIRLTITEYADNLNENRDYAVNMGRGVDPYLEELMKKRESMVSNLDTLKGQLDLSKKKRLSRNEKGSQNESRPFGKGKEADNRAANTAGDTAENL